MVVKIGVVDMNCVKHELKFNGYEELHTFDVAPPGWKIQARAQESKSDQRSDSFTTGQGSTCIVELGPYLVDDTSFSTSSLCPAPLCRQFWKAGNYEDVFTSKTAVQSSQNYLHVHPKFLHSNATSHKWAFGAIAELVDNAVDEIQNGATFVIIDKISNPRDGSPALLIQDDGGGMAPEAIRCCMSFGFSDKDKSAIGQYGNGFKTSTMRLGADVIVFSRHMDDINRTTTQSIGLLSYTFLSRTGLDRIVVPMVDYKYSMSSTTSQPLYRYGKENYLSNLSIILQWSPYSTEAELMKQFDDIGSHGTKVIVYNLWLTNDGTLELDFESDQEDVRLRGSEISEKTRSDVLASEEHIGNQYRYSLKVYLSILYLRPLQNFYIILRRKIADHHCIALDLKWRELIKYKPQTGGTKEEVLTTIGFLKEAPRVNIRGFNVYHKNRLILPFLHVYSSSGSKGRGVVGVLEVNFIEPTHNKQDFERTSLFQKLENRLKEMTTEYWDCYCGHIGYHQVKKKTQTHVLLPDPSDGGIHKARYEAVIMSKSSNLGSTVVSLSAVPSVQKYQSSSQQSGVKRTQDELLFAPGRGSSQAMEEPDATGRSTHVQPYAEKPLHQQEAVMLMIENKKLRLKCSQHEKIEEELNRKVGRLRSELEAAENEYASMINELKALQVVKAEKILWTML